MSLKHLIFSSNTSIGKTLLSLSLSSHITKTKPLTYIKPLQCGTPWDEDLIKTYSDTTNLNLNSITIKAYDPYPCSPHLASILTGERTKEYITDDEINENILNSITSGHNIIETAGGVLSPSIAFPSAPLKGYMSYKDTNLVYTTQANLYSRLNLPSILVGDPKLGGVSTTISSLESLLSHGNRVEGIVFFGNDKSYDLVSNRETVEEYCKMIGLETKFYCFPAPPVEREGEDLWEFLGEAEVKEGLKMLIDDLGK